MTEIRPAGERAGARADGRTAMTRASDGLPPRFYDPARGRAEPPAVLAARERHRALNAALEAGEIMPDTAADWEWCRELRDE